MKRYLHKNLQKTGKNSKRDVKTPKRPVFLILAALLMMTLATAQVEFRDSNPFQFYNDVQLQQGDVDIQEGNITMNNNRILGLPEPTSSGEPLTQGSGSGNYVDRTGDSMSGDLDLQDNFLQGNNGEIDFSSGEMILDQQMPNSGSPTTIQINQDGTPKWALVSMQDGGLGVYDATAGEIVQEFNENGQLELQNNNVAVNGTLSVDNNELQDLLNIKSTANNDLRIGAGSGGSDRVRIRDNANGEDIAEFEEGTQNVYVPNGKLDLNRNYLDFNPTQGVRITPGDTSVSDSNDNSDLEYQTDGVHSFRGGDLTVQDNNIEINEPDAGYIRIGNQTHNDLGDDETHGIMTYWDSDFAFFGLRDYGDDRKDAIISIEQRGDNIRFQGLEGEDLAVIEGTGDMEINQGGLRINDNLNVQNGQFEVLNDGYAEYDAAGQNWQWKVDENTRTIWEVENENIDSDRVWGLRVEGPDNELVIQGKGSKELVAVDDQGNVDLKGSNITSVDQMEGYMGSRGRICPTDHYLYQGYCAEKGLHYEPNNNCDGTNANDRTNGVCESMMDITGTAADAVQTCSGDGGRLPTPTELDLIAGTGNGWDRSSTWVQVAEGSSNINNAYTGIGLATRAPDYTTLENAPVDFDGSSPGDDISEVQHVTTFYMAEGQGTDQHTGGEGAIHCAYDP